MDNPTLDVSTAVLVAICLAHDGYRRAGVAFVRGENVLSDDLSDEQLAAIKADPRIRVQTAEGISEPALVSTQGSMDTTDGNTPLTFAEAIAKLAPDNKEHFTSGNKPQTAALTQLMGKPISAAERDALWQSYQDAQNEGGAE
ncbi:HI1506-related protein [Shewanella algae]|uniref:HI1506-related protein n=1 Tax=Shewanella algae TaxID=38313 RepID=UPI000F421449|nr:HI1506-related protein [Shewanella algae]AYV12988.1 hypothetical protein EEY24_08875 [Shewanella algae]BCV29198.1 phage protein [Shewanella algae]